MYGENDDIIIENKANVSEQLNGELTNADNTREIIMGDLNGRTVGTKTNDKTIRQHN